MHKIQPRPMALGNAVEIRPMMYLALSYDHRIVDGREAVTFLVRLKDAIEDPRRLLLDLCTPAPARHSSNNPDNRGTHGGHLRSRGHRRRTRRLRGRHPGRAARHEGRLRRETRRPRRTPPG